MQTNSGSLKTYNSIKTRLYSCKIIMTSLILIRSMELWLHLMARIRIHLGIESYGVPWARNRHKLNEICLGTLRDKVVRLVCWIQRGRKLMKSRLLIRDWKTGHHQNKAQVLTVIFMTSQYLTSTPGQNPWRKRKIKIRISLACLSQGQLKQREPQVLF